MPRTCVCEALTIWPVLTSYRRRFRSSVAIPSCTIRFSEQVFRLLLASFLPPEPQKCILIGAHYNLRIGAADEGATVVPCINPRLVYYQ